jgi:IclR family pca regulon transcriptional regulator
VDQELEMGLRSIAVPVTSRGKVVAALNVGTSAARLTTEEMRTRLLPALLACAERLGD